MAENTLTAIIPDIYEALDVVSRELTGMIPAVSMAASADRAAKDQNIQVDIAPTIAAGDITPAMVVPDPTGLTSTATTIQITKERAASFGFNGNDQKALNTGVGYMNHRAGKIAQAIRTLTNEVEVDLAALQSTCSRAYGTAGTTPFGTANDYTDASNVLKILKDNGAAPTDNQLVINTSAGANFLGKQSAVNAAGTDSMLRQGVLLDLAGMPIRESAQIVTGTAGTASSATTDTAGYAVGAVTITLASAGTGAILAGDFISFAGDSEKYMVTTGDADVSGGGTVVLAAPGLRTVIAGSATAITVVATSARNMAFNRSAIVLAARAPARPEEGDLAIDSTIITDPRSGLSLEFSMYAGYRKMRYEVALAWGVKNIKPEHTAILLG
ncbi:MAG: P22 coat - protein 5 family protein [Gammaproteobacteria bacterium]|jgi:hypothetical protein|nr:P22 coat - protein 5 family protein [Gammaproteobacteria bacterium]